MPEPAQANHDTTDLERQVGDLLDEMQASTQRLAAEANAAPASTGATDAELAKAASALAQEQAAPAAPTPTPAAAIEPPKPAAPQDAKPQVAAATPGAEPDLAAAVNQLLDSAAPAASAPAKEAGGGNVEQLDAKLAGLADEVIAGEFQDEARVMKEQQAAEPAPAAPEAAAPKPVAKAPPAALPLPPPPEPKTPKEPADAAPAPVVAAPAPSESRAGAAALKYLSVLSAPLQGRPHLRDILGWVALVQAFLAMCVWVYVLFVRSDRPVDPPPVTAAKEVAPEGQESGEGHQAKKSAKGAKKPAKKSSHASTASAAHH